MPAGNRGRGKIVAMSKESLREKVTKEELSSWRGNETLKKDPRVDVLLYLTRLGFRQGDRNGLEKGMPLSGGTVDRNK